MGKLEDIPKKEFFRVPEDYFDKLPAQIQSRIVTAETVPAIQPVLRYAWLYAIPVLLAAVLIFYRYESQPDAESLLTSVETADLIQYLQESELTTEEVLENLDLNSEELEALENEVYYLNLKDAQEEFPELEMNTP